jgi:hypothetical protein
MCVRALRMTVLKSAGNFTRDEYHDLKAEKIQRVKCFMFTRCGICCVLAIFERRRGRLGSKISGYGQLAEVAVYFAMSGLPRKPTPIGRVGMFERCHGLPSRSGWKSIGSTAMERLDRRAVHAEARACCIGMET